MKEEGWSKYWIRSLLRDELTKVMLRDARNETPWIKEITCIACEGAPVFKEVRDMDDEDSSFEF